MSQEPAEALQQKVEDLSIEQAPEDTETQRKAALATYWSVGEDYNPFISYHAICVNGYYAFNEQRKTVCWRVLCTCSECLKKNE